MRHTALRYYYYKGSTGVPTPDDALFHLNGVIEEDSGSYYFSDNSGNGRRFLITNKDFPSDWTVGFPYKSKATISAPAGDATLIAADINNYLYDSGGTPNAIPVVSLFQDIDYEHKIFCRHRSQVLNENDEEIIAPRVAEMVMYNSVRSGADLTRCQNYFDVPTEAAANVKWVSKTGNDTTGTGSKAAPWLTLAKATQSATNGDTVYVKTGNYQENHTGTTGYWMITRSCTVVGLGFINVTSANTSFAAFNNATNTLSFRHINLGNAAASSTGTFALSASFASTISFDKCWIKNGAYGISAATSPSLTVTNCIYSGTTNRFVASGNTTLTIKGCHTTDTTQPYVSSATALTTAVIQYNNFNNGTVTNTYTVDLNYSFNKVTSLIDIAGTAAAITASTSRLVISRNTVNNTGIYVRTNYYNCSILNNYLTVTGAATGSLIFAAEQTTLQVKENRLINAAKTSGILCDSTTALAKNYTIEGNRIESGASFTPIQIGDESTSAGYHTVTGTIKNNIVIGTNTTAAHGVVAFNQSGVNIRHNRISGYAFGAIVKVAGTDLSNADISYNLFINCVNGVSAKGGLNQSIVNNTIVNATGKGVEIVQNESGDNTLGTILKNNIIYEGGAASSYVAISYQTGSTLTSNNNLIYSLNNANKFSTGGANITLAQWLSAGYDGSSLTTNPSLNANYVPTSPITIGEDLGDSYDTGLDVSTDWGSSGVTPVVVTNDQVAEGAWEIGAYVQR